jgi:hypothetical protein
MKNDNILTKKLNNFDCAKIVLFSYSFQRDKNSMTNKHFNFFANMFHLFFSLNMKIKLFYVMIDFWISNNEAIKALSHLEFLTPRHNYKDDFETLES